MVVDEDKVANRSQGDRSDRQVGLSPSAPAVRYWNFDNCAFVPGEGGNPKVAASFAAGEDLIAQILIPPMRRRH